MTGGEERENLMIMMIRGPTVSRSRNKRRCSGGSSRMERRRRTMKTTMTMMRVMKEQRKKRRKSRKGPGVEKPLSDRRARGIEVTARAAVRIKKY